MLWKAALIWCLIIGLETVAGTLRVLYLEPAIGTMPARQIGVGLGIVIIFFISWRSLHWIGTHRAAHLLWVGAVWVGLTLLFEIFLVKVVFQEGWDRFWIDYDITQGGLMGIGLFCMLLSPLLAAYLRK